MKTSVDLIGKI
nr:unnamed protein product [Callosobruchus analis]